MLILGVKSAFDKVKKFTEENHNANIFYNLGQKRYLSLLKYADVMIGNSSSGIIESPIFKLPVVNIEDRQKGRIKNRNVIDTGYTVDDICAGIYRALYDKKFRGDLRYIENLYGNGTTSRKVVLILKYIDINKKLLIKKLTY